MAGNSGKSKSPFLTGGAGAQIAEVFNSGLEAWLYDASFREKLKALGAFDVDTETTDLEPV